MSRAERRMRDESARKRRRTVKAVVAEKAQHLYDKMRRLRKKKQH